MQETWSNHTVLVDPWLAEKLDALVYPIWQHAESADIIVYLKTTIFVTDAVAAQYLRWFSTFSLSRNNFDCLFNYHSFFYAKQST